MVPMAQYSSHEFAAFADSYNFKHVTSSPLFPQSNGRVERTVKTVKQLLERSDDPFTALLSYQATPLPWCGFSPAELSMGRKVRSTVPQVKKHLTPGWSYLEEFKEKNAQFKDKQKGNFDRRHCTRDTPEIPDDTEVWVNSGRESVRGRVVTTSDTPRFYVVSTPTGDVRRNRSHLTVVPPTEEVPEPTNIVPVPELGHPQLLLRRLLLHHPSLPVHVLIQAPLYMVLIIYIINLRREMWKNLSFISLWFVVIIVSCMCILVCHHVVKHLSATCLLVHTT